MPLPAHLELTGAKQGKIDGSCDMTGREASILVYGILHGVSLPHDRLSGAPTEKRRHAPLTILKEMDKSSPKLYQALVTGEQLSDVTVKYYKTSRAGTEDHFFTIMLTDAVVTYMKAEKPIVFLPENSHIETWK